MARRFPHMSHDAFPHLDNVRPSERITDYDYGRYDYTAELKLCRVPWPSDYRHVVNWADAAARDAYFDSLQGTSIELQNSIVHVQTDSVMVPVPYDVALMYNYVFMRVPELTPGNPIDYESGPHVRIICAFIGECAYHSPSATELMLSIDMWTTYLPHLSPTMLMLHRGHAPAYAVDVDEYLSNPREHNTNLLTPDVTFGAPDVAAYSEVHPIGGGEKMLVLASTIPYTTIESLTLAQDEAGNTTGATYHNESGRYGYQVGVDDYEWHYGGKSYTGMRNPSRYMGTGGAVPTYMSLYAIPATSARSVLDSMASLLPQFIQSVHAAYVLPRDVLTLADTTLAVAGVSLYRVVPSLAFKDVAHLHLDKAQFAYPTRYRNIAKLYTSPYARLTVGDGLGNELEVRIEDLGANPLIEQQISVVSECLRWDILLTGINSAGTNRYAWKSLANTDYTFTLPGADIGRYTLELGIPTYALYLDGRADTAADRWYDTQAQRASAINTYKATMRSANTAKENADDSADTAKTNADASADTAKANTDASAETNVTNTQNNGSNATANTGLANQLRSSSTARNNQAANNIKDINVQNVFDSLYLDDEYTMQASDVNLKSEAVAGATNTLANAAIGNAIGVLTSGISAIVNISTSSALSTLSSEQIEGKEAVGQAYHRDVTAENVSNASDQATLQNTNATNVTRNNVSTANTNATNSANTAKANATRSQGTAKSNATRSQGTAKSNAAYSRGTTETNAKAALELARLNYNRSGHAHDMDNPSVYGTVSGDASADALMRRIVQVRIDTQSASAIARAGDAMLRYGYIYDGLWSVTDWCPGEHDGCYWEASDVSAPAINYDNPAAERAFESILTEGVTIWKDPDKIGGVPW